VFILVALFVDFHANFDRFHEHADRIYSVVQILPSSAEGKRHSARTPAPLLPLLSNEFDEIEDATRWIPTDKWIVRAENKPFFTREGRLWGVDPNFLSFFSFKMISGNPETALKEPNSVVLAESLGSIAANFCVDDNAYCVGLDINANHVRAMRKGTVTGTASPLHLGVSTQVWQINIVDEQQRLVCTSRLTIAVKYKNKVNK